MHRRRTLRRLQVSLLVVVVLAATGIGGVALLRALTFKQAVGGSGLGRIVFIQVDRNRGHVAIVAPNGVGTRVLTSGPYADSQPAWSPDGREIAFVREDCCEPGPALSSVWTVRSDGTNLVRLTKGPRDSAPVWSPDGTQLAYVRGTLDGSSNLQIRVVRRDGAQDRALTSGTVDDLSPSWSPDGRWIAFAGVGEPRGSGGVSLHDWLWIARVDGTDLQKIGSLPVGAPDTIAWSPDGSLVAYDAIEDLYPPCPPPPPGQVMICKPIEDHVIGIVSPGGSVGDRILPADGLSDVDLVAPEWSPDGQRLAVFLRHRSSPSTVSLMTVRLDGSGSRILAKDVRAAVPSASWSPDGTLIAFSGDGHIHLVGPDGAGVRTVGRGVQAAWQPTPSASPFPETSSPTPTPKSTPPSPPSQAECAASESSAHGDFDGDGTTDVASIGPASCVPLSDLVHPTPTDLPWYVWIDYPGAGGGAWAMPACDADVCKAYGAFDLNGDGRDELGVVVSEGASTQFIEFFEVTLGPEGPLALTVAPPGSTGFPGGEPARFPLGGSVTHTGELSRSCGGSDLISDSLTVSSDQATWTLRRTTLAVPGRGQPLDPFFTVVATGTYTGPVGSPEPDVCLAPLNP